MTQGRTKKEAFEMIKDAIEEIIYSYFEVKISIEANEYENGVIGISSNENKILLALSLRRQREISSSTVREASERLGSKSPNAYAQYEKGKTRISLDKYEKLLHAANPYKQSYLRVRVV